MSEEPKKETVRITLPPRPTNGIAGGVVKHETVRITTSIQSPVAETAPPPLNPPPKPLGAGLPPKPLGAGLPPKPLGTGLPPKPLGAGLPPRPAAPFAPKPLGALNPAVPPAAPKPFSPLASSATAPGPLPSVPKPFGNIAPVAVKPSPKKETARIQPPSTPKSLPQATLKLQQTQSVAATPGAAVKPAGAVSQKAAPQKQESLLVSVLVFAVSVIAFGIQLWTYVS
ncbi:MAG TPA: hypothetical protein VIT91_04590 [Chthoniobacterales bacterium]